MEKQIRRVYFCSDPFCFAHLNSHHVDNVPIHEQRCLALYKLCKTPLLQGAGLECSVVPADRLRLLAEQVYSSVFNDTTKPGRRAWDIIYTASPKKEHANLFKSSFCDSLLVGFELSPFFTGILNLLEQPYINVQLHPARFLNDLLLDVSSNAADLSSFLESKAIPEGHLYLAAGHVEARYAPNVCNFNNRLPDNSLLVLPGTVPPVFTREGQVISLADAGNRLKDIVSQYSHTIILDKEYGPELYSKQEQDFLQTLSPCVVPLSRSHKYYTINSLYMLFAHPSISGVAGVYNKQLEEGKYFHKNIHTLHYPGAAQPPMGYTLDNSFFSLSFWADLFAFLRKDHCLHPADSFAPLPNLRMIFRNADSDFDDAQSYSHCLQIGEISRRLKRLEWQDECTRVQRIADQRHSFDISVETEGQPPFAIYSNGDENCAVQAIVALHSAGTFTSCRNLFYITQRNRIPGDIIDLFDKYKITVIHSDYANQYSTSYLHTTPYAYLQFVGPELLQKKGFDYSIAVQYDTVCIQQFDPYHVFKSTTYFSGTHTHFMRNIASFVDLDKVAMTTPLSATDYTLRLVNPGILFANNNRLAEMGFAQRALNVFSALGSENLVFNEESILSFFAAAQENFLSFIEEGYNYLHPYPGANEVYFLHFLDRIKPWNVDHFPLHKRSLPILYKLFPIWHSIAEDIFGKDFPHICEKYFTACKYRQ